MEEAVYPVEVTRRDTFPGSSAAGHPDMKGVMFGTTTDREKKDEYLLHFSLRWIKRFMPR